ncbi:hypothetical protein E6O75_ATG02020 [Venturia nashicola]|uniref:Uncharacterized protein n=1 Tax=Venturia nashicola TaxID=86259 RepID=A0A4Z1PCL0_9PEZI|nr:hypothetical protein E6O75_ATG02020 [Venturia nashicola]
MSDATTISNDDFAARIAFVQQDLRRELGGMEARAEHSNDRVQIAMAALDEAIVEEQEQRRSSTKLDEAQRSSTKAPRKVTPPPLPPSAPTTPLSRNTMVDGADTNPGLMDAMIDNASPRRKKKLFTTAKCPKRGEAVSSGVYSADKKAAMEAHNVSVGESVIDVRHLRDVNYAVDWVPKCAMPVLAPIPMVAMHQIHRPD